MVAARAATAHWSVLAFVDLCGVVVASVLDLIALPVCREPVAAAAEGIATSSGCSY